MALGASAPGRSATSSWSEGSWSPDPTPVPASAGRSSASCRCTPSGCGCSRPRPRASRSTSRSAATGRRWGLPYETLVRTHPELLASPGFLYLNAVGLTADGVATVGFLLMIGAFPDGVLERRWQRVALGSVWVCVLVAPLTLLTTPRRAAAVLGLTRRSRTPRRPGARVGGTAGRRVWSSAPGSPPRSAPRPGEPGLQRRRRGPGRACGSWPGPCSSVGSWVLWMVTRELGHPGTPLGLVGGADDAEHARAARGGHPRHPALRRLRRRRRRPRPGRRAVVDDPHHGPLRHRGRRAGRAALRPAGARERRPAHGVPPCAAPGARLAAAGRTRAVLGDREHHLVLLSELGARLEQAMDLDEVLARLAEGVRGGLDATWVRVRARRRRRRPRRPRRPSPATVSGSRGDPGPHARRRAPRPPRAGPRRRGAYGVAELALLETVARQATTAVANVRLTAELADQLGELTASRTRLITAQDEERRRIERNLHDGIQQSVVALIAGLGLARNRLGRGELRPLELVELQDQARETLTDLRELAHGIHPQVLTDNGLVAAVESRTARSRSRSRIAASAVRHGDRARTSRQSRSTPCARRWPTSPSTQGPAAPGVALGRRRQAARRGRRRRDGVLAAADRLARRSGEHP